MFIFILFYNHHEPPKRFAHRLRWVHSVGRTQVLKDLDDVIPPKSQWKAAPPEKKGASADGELLKERTKWNCWLCKAKIKQEPVKARSVLLLHSIYFGHSDYLATEMKKHVSFIDTCVWLPMDNHTFFFIMSNWQPATLLSLFSFMVQTFFPICFHLHG